MARRAHASFPHILKHRVSLGFAESILEGVVLVTVWRAEVGHDGRIAEADLNDTARAAIAWTRAQFTSAQRNFFRGLPLAAEQGDALFVHASNVARQLDKSPIITFHVFEAANPAAALLDYARKNHVDHIVIGARESSAWRWYLGSISSQVVAEAPCTVTVVRTPAQDARSGAGPDSG